MPKLSPLQLVPSFMAGVLLCLGLIYALTLFQLGVPNPNSLNYRGIINFKKERARAVVGPKILICAGSSALLGLRADMITQVTGLTTINMGVGAALGIPTSCRWAQELAKPGDTVLLVFEYNLFDWTDLVLDDAVQKVSSVHYNSIFVDYLLAYDPQWFREMSPKEQVKVLLNLSNKRLLDGVARKCQVILHPNYLEGINQHPENLDDYGDALGSTVTNRPVNAGLDDVIHPLVAGLPERPRGFTCLQGFIQWCRAHQVRVLATWPNLLSRPEYYGPVARATVHRIAAFYQSEGVPVIGNYEDALLPREQFYDTVYHLVESAAKERTTRLLNQWPKSLLNN